MTVLCLVELDASGATDASLRALSFARSLASVAGLGPAGAGPSPPAGPPTPASPAGPPTPASPAGPPTPASPAGPPTPASPPGPGGGGLAAVLFGEATDVPREVLAAYGVSGVYVTEPGRLAGYAPLAWARTLAGLIAQTGASAVVAAATDRGNEVMAHLGALSGQPMAANTVSAERAGAGSYRIVRQRWAGLLLEDAVLEAPVALLTVATDAVQASPADAPAGLTVHLHEPELAEGDLLVRATESTGQSAGISLASARVVVGGGRGVGSAEGFAPLEELAGLLGGVVGVSRVVTSEGWRPHRQQVGQTGTKITPELYLACGISGAIQHIAGCASAKHIVAVNKDAGAPILTHAEYAVIGDLHEVIPALITAIRDRAARPA